MHGVHGTHGQVAVKLVEEDCRSGQEKLVHMKKMGERHVVAFLQSSRAVILERVQLVTPLLHMLYYFLQKYHDAYKLIDICLYHQIIHM